MTDNAGQSGEIALVLTTVPGVEAGEEIARRLVEERLIACANLVPGLTSVFRWEGEVKREGEVLLLMKTPVSVVERLFVRAAELHPYEVPELVSIPIAAGAQAFCRWVAAETVEGTE